MKKRDAKTFLVLVIISCLGIRLSAAEENCGIENCHGAKIECGANIAQQCSMMYAFGDRCRDHAQCQMIDSHCQLVESEQYKGCMECVNDCEQTFKDDLPQAFACESSCG